MARHFLGEQLRVAPGRSDRGKLLMTHHVARRLGRSPRCVRWMAQNGRLPAVRVGKRAWRFWESDIEAYRLRRA